ncbi:MAG: CoA ester lyase [Chloroflexi bacterium]|nr:CoA ester lyase [Chloroflexota bacterium]MYB20950.1 CoA ester lyase [Chloroflexota bacterium]MYD17986.1 CoA ester lyase [Chloroflexota bacterium]MYF82356.1 CoA ester lyase [Chloroflexota bacterium]MYI05611.1 CoA ester lyase [Chloroflexota bacterium]
MAATVMRSMLSVPGIRERFIEKARDAEADVLCFDLEDSVAWDDKPAARDLLCRVLPDFPKRGRQVFVRTNGYDTGLIEQELDAIVQPWLDGVSVSKIESARDIQRIDDYLTLLERARGLPDGQVKLAAWIENAHAVANAYEICAASERLVGICVGGEDYAVSIGVRRTKGGAELELARRASVNAAHAAGVVPLDTPWTDIRDPEGFEDELRRMKEIGFQGKFCIHPDQLGPANQIFSPPADDVDWARRVVDAYQDGVEQNLGAVALDGQMIDKPVLEQAENVLAWSEQIAAMESAR